MINQVNDSSPRTDNSETMRDAADTATQIVCEAMLDISSASELHARLLDALAAGRPVSLDGADVERADTAALQVLTAFFQDARTKNIAVTWSSASDALARSAALLGLDEVLDLRQ